VDKAKEILSLIKFSSKRENLLGEIKGNLEALNLKPRTYLAFALLDGQNAQAVFTES